MSNDDFAVFYPVIFNDKEKTKRKEKPPTVLGLILISPFFIFLGGYLIAESIFFFNRNDIFSSLFFLIIFIIYAIWALIKLNKNIKKIKQ